MIPFKPSDGSTTIHTMPHNKCLNETKLNWQRTRNPEIKTLLKIQTFLVNSKSEIGSDGLPPPRTKSKSNTATKNSAKLTKILQNVHSDDDFALPRNVTTSNRSSPSSSNQVGEDMLNSTQRSTKTTNIKVLPFIIIDSDWRRVADKLITTTLKSAIQAKSFKRIQ